MQTEIDDLAPFAEANSDHLVADDLIAGPEVFTISRIALGGQDRPVVIHLAEREGRPWMPCKTVLRVLMAAWGRRPADWPVGARVRLYRDPDVRYGGKQVGGIRVDALSGISEPLEVSVTVARGKRQAVRVGVLQHSAPPPSRRDRMLAKVLDMEQQIGGSPGVLWQAAGLQDEPEELSEAALVEYGRWLAERVKGEEVPRG